VVAVWKSRYSITLRSGQYSRKLVEEKSDWGFKSGVPETLQRLIFLPNNRGLFWSRKYKQIDSLP
jgi:hypothetical protein